jgi:hypothetical protein
MKQLTSSLLTIISVCLLCSFGGDVKPLKKTDWIPAGFDANNSILLIEQLDMLTSAKKLEKMISGQKEIMQTIYPYKYEFATTTDLNDESKYTDKKTYKWVLKYTTGTHQIPNFNGMGYMTVGYFDFYIYDREANVNYPVTGYSDSYPLHAMKPIVATLVKFLKEHPGVQNKSAETPH